MASNTRVHAIRKHLEAHILMATEELNILFESIVGVADHPDYFNTVEDKLCQLSEYQGALDALNTHFMED